MASAKIDFRTRAHAHLKRGRSLLESEDDQLLVYAALELRKCMEAITYQRAQAYLEDLPPRLLANSQPQRIMQALLDIDPYADMEVRLEMSEGAVVRRARQPSCRLEQKNPSS